jgi:hypothetical protein
MKGSETKILAPAVIYRLFTMNALFAAFVAPETRYERRSSRTTMDLEVGVLLTSATESSGISTLVSGK